MSSRPSDDTASGQSSNKLSICLQQFCESLADLADQAIQPARNVMSLCHAASHRGDTRQPFLLQRAPRPDDGPSGQALPALLVDADALAKGSISASIRVTAAR